MIESVKRAFDKGAFENENKCLIDLETIETYHQILAPAYRVSLGFQKNSSSIADVIPNILQMIDIWKKFDLPPVPNRLCKRLIACVKQKFNFELNSITYQVCKILVLLFF